MMVCSGMVEKRMGMFGVKVRKEDCEDGDSDTD
jgi:hypothetical protein